MVGHVQRQHLSDTPRAECPLVVLGKQDAARTQRAKVMVEEERRCRVHSGLFRHVEPFPIRRTREPGQAQLSSRALQINDVQQRREQGGAGTDRLWRRFGQRV